MLARLTASVGLIVMTALLVTLASSDESFGQTKQQKKEQKKLEKAIKAQQKKAQQVMNSELKGEEAELLRKVYILVSTTNANYAGHRVKALKHIEQAANILDKQIIAKGNDAQQAETLRQDAIKDYVKANRKLAGKENEAQVISDAQLYQAGQVLAQLKAVMQKNKQAKVAKQVDDAIDEIALALKSR